MAREAKGLGFSMSSPGRSPMMASRKSSGTYTDDIDCLRWLSEINLSEYSETFLVNMSVDNRYLSRKRLSQVRQQDLSKMNITNFAHQKILMDHIRHVLRYNFDNPERKRELREIKSRHGIRESGSKPESLPKRESKEDSYGNTMGSPADSKQASASSKRSTARSTDNGDVNFVENYKVEKGSDQLKTRKKEARRRRSFDNQVWQTISNLRTKQQSIAHAADHLREGVLQNTDLHKKSGASKTRRRRWSFGETGDAPNHPAGSVHSQFDKAMNYGNMAQEYDIILTNLRKLQDEHLAEFKAMINCEIASILFLNDRTRDLMLYTGTAWYRIPSGSGIAGYCAETGESVNISDVYSDYRFNRNLDIRTGFRTRNMLCQPVRGMRGGGAVVGVIQMINKRKGPRRRNKHNADLSNTADSNLTNGTSGTSGTKDDGADDEASVDNDGTVYVEFDRSDEDTLSACAQRVADELGANFQELLSVAEKFAGNAIFVGGKGGEMFNKTKFNSETKSSTRRAQEG